MRVSLPGDSPWPALPLPVPPPGPPSHHPLAPLDGEARQAAFSIFEYHGVVTAMTSLRITGESRMSPRLGHRQDRKGSVVPSSGRARLTSGPSLFFAALSLFRLEDPAAGSNSDVSDGFFAPFRCGRVVVKI
ncbi:hypothetical protein KM043_016961 [Ampulex compressa]|nr:hypothetical protein KM043_016961 [Ampulex compressa]